jgi:HAD superfamily hydrolase (TIGR01459 family)
LSNRLTPRQMAGIGEIADRFRAWFVDVYGVLHDGSYAFPGVVDALTRLRQSGATIVIVTNSAQRIEAVARRLGQAGIAPAAYDHIVSSGELSWRYLERRETGDEPLHRLFLLHESGGPPWIRDLPNPIVRELGQADLILAADMPYRTEDEAEASDLLATLHAASSLGLPLMVADSDETYPQGGVIRLGPGWIARRYRELGGKTVEFGKPYAPIFTAASGLCGADPRKAIMVGDNLATDIAGAKGAGLASLLVLGGGVHGMLSERALSEAMERCGAEPDFIASALAW